MRPVRSLVNKFLGIHPVETEELFHDIQQTLRLSGIPPYFRELSTLDNFLDEAWKTMRPNFESATFEDFADEIRLKAVSEVQNKLKVKFPNPSIGESQMFHIESHLALFSYMNPKLLLVNACFKEILKNKKLFGSGINFDAIPRGVPQHMIAMEWVNEENCDKEVKKRLGKIQQVLKVNRLPVEFLTLAQWPDYFNAITDELLFHYQGEAFQNIEATLLKESDHLIHELPLMRYFDVDSLMSNAQTIQKILKFLTYWKYLLPTQNVFTTILQVALHDEKKLSSPPYPIEHQGRVH
jgi:hypothetical protein